MISFFNKNGLEDRTGFGFPIKHNIKYDSKKEFLLRNINGKVVSIDKVVNSRGLVFSIKLLKKTEVLDTESALETILEAKKIYNLKRKKEELDNFIEIVKKFFKKSNIINFISNGCRYGFSVDFLRKVMPSKMAEAYACFAINKPYLLVVLSEDGNEIVYKKLFKNAKNAIEKIHRILFSMSLLEVNKINENKIIQKAISFSNYHHFITFSQSNWKEGCKMGVCVDLDLI